MLTEKEKMIAGELYDATDAQLVADRRRARDLTRAFNASTADEGKLRKSLLSELFSAFGHKSAIEPPFYCDYGYNTFLGDSVFMNFNCVILDVVRVEIGGGTMLGPNVQIYTATHPMDYRERSAGLEFGKPIKIGADVWIGGSVVINPGVTIGDRSVIGSGSVVVKDIPAGVFAAGNPCRVIRYLENPAEMPGDCNLG